MRSVLITGANGGVGRALSERLAARGFTVHACGRGAELDMDVTDPASVERVAEQVAADVAADGLHAVINNAGVIVQGPLELVPEAELRRQFEVNVYGPANVMRAFLPLLRKGKGRIVNISAPTARTAIPFLAPISASKAALESLSDAARIELAPWDIPVVLIQPGAMATPIFDKAGAAARTALAQAPAERRTLYGKQLEALDKMLAGQRLSPVTAVVDAIVRAVEARRPRPRYVVGADARALVLLSRLPTRLRDRLLTRTLGLA